MLLVQDYITKKQNEHRNHIFYQTLKKQENFLEAMTFTKDLAFWVMSFQDILRLIPPQIKSKALRRIATHHKIEDGGHNIWFLEDLEFLNKNNKGGLNIKELFSKEHELTRDFSYKMVAEALKPSKDHEKITLILALESGGHVFFEETANFVNLKGHSLDLKYFSSYHLEVEQSHAVFEEKLMQDLLNISLNEEERDANIAVVDCFYNGVNSLFDHLYTSISTK
jgi:hypothetical protein